MGIIGECLTGAEREHKPASTQGGDQVRQYRITWRITYRKKYKHGILSLHFARSIP
jgi:hypothetical protein